MKCNDVYKEIIDIFVNGTDKDVLFMKTAFKILNDHPELFEIKIDKMYDVYGDEIYGELKYDE